MQLVPIAMCVVLAISGLAGCSLHRVQLVPAPAATAPLEERDAYWQDHHPLGIAGQPSSANQVGLATDAAFPMVQLADGRRISNVEDLLPAVASDSATARAVVASEQARSTANVAWTGSLLAIIGGVTAVTLSPLFALTPGGGIDNPAFWALYAGGGLAMVVGVIGSSLAVMLAEHAEAERMTAMLLYGRDLERNLGLVRPEDARPASARWVTPAASPPAASRPPAPPPPASVSPTPPPVPPAQPPPVDPEEAGLAPPDPLGG
jgi:hypothetical protein